MAIHINLPFAEIIKCELDSQNLFLQDIGRQDLQLDGGKGKGIAAFVYFCISVLFHHTDLLGDNLKKNQFGAAQREAAARRWQGGICHQKRGACVEIWKISICLVWRKVSDTFPGQTRKQTENFSPASYEIAYYPPAPPAESENRKITKSLANWPENCVQTETELIWTWTAEQFILVFDFWLLQTGWVSNFSDCKLWQTFSY